MNHHHRKVLHQIFQHPVNANLAFQDVESVLRELGAEIDNRHGSRIGVTLKGHTVAFHHAAHSLPKEEVQQVRKFLEACDVDPARDWPV
ncbi:MAG: hypothetical protein VYB54_06300 [Pseudomonadota bacterium]|nr:hypothetical protein [Pseudomonadota bacterium]